MMRETVVLVVATLLGGSLAVGAGPSASSTIQLPGPDGHTCKVALNGGNVTVAGEGKVTKLSFGGVVTVGSGCFSQVQQQTLFQREMTFAVTNLTMTLNTSAEGGPAITEMRADRIVEAAK